MFVFQKIWHALFSRNTRFEIRPFVLLLTGCAKIQTLLAACQSFEIVRTCNTDPTRKNVSHIVFFQPLHVNNSS